MSRTDCASREVPISELSDEEFAALMRSGIPNIIPAVVPNNIGINAIAASAVDAEVRGEYPRMQYRPHWGYGDLSGYAELEAKLKGEACPFRM